MAANSSAVASAILYLCATSATAILLATFGANAASAANIAASHRGIAFGSNDSIDNGFGTRAAAAATTTTAHDDDVHRAGGVQKPDTHNASHANNVNNGQIVLASSDNGIAHASDGRADEHAGEVEQPERHLHLNEYNIVATTPKMLTTDSPNRYRIP